MITQEKLRGREPRLEVNVMRDGTALVHFVSDVDVVHGGQMVVLCDSRETAMSLVTKLRKAPLVVKHEPPEKRDYSAYDPGH